MSHPQKNIVLVGAGLAAVGFIKAILPRLPPSHRIVVIDAAHPYFPIASLRAAVVPGWEDKPVAPTNRIFPVGSKHVVLTGTSVVELREHSVVVNKVHSDLDFSQEIAFSHCILATGSTYPFPCRPSPGATPEQTMSSLRALQSSIAASSSLLIVGGGPVGIEFAGEVAAHYSGDKADKYRRKKSITLVHSHEKFLYEEGWKDRFNKGLERQLRVYGVDVRMSRKVTTEGLKTGRVQGGMQHFTLSDGSVVSADFVFVAHGSAPATSFLSPSSSPMLKGVLNASKAVIVKPSFQLEHYNHIFAIGDMTDVPESKVFIHAQNHGPIAAKNLLASLKSPSPSSSSSALKSYSAGAKMIGVSIGPKGGAGQFNGVVVGAWLIGKMKAKGLFVSDFKKLYNVPI